MLVISVDEILGGHFYAQVDHPIAVVGQDDLHQVLADVVHIPLDRGQDHLSFGGSIQPLHVGLQVGHRELHGLRGLEHLGYDELVGGELPAYLVHPGHQRPVDDRQGSPGLQGLVQVFGQPLLGALDDGQGQPLVQGEVTPFGNSGLGGLIPEVGGEGRHRVVTPAPDEVFGQLPLLFGYGGVALHRLRANDGQVQPRLDAVVEEHRVEDLPACRRQSEGDVGNPQNGLGGGQGFLDKSDPFDGLRSSADVVFVAGAYGEDQGVEDNVLGRHAVFVGEEPVGAPGDVQFALPGNSLGLLLVFVDATHHQGGAVAPGQGNHRLKAGLAVLKVDGVDDGLALEALEGFFDDPGVGGVDHDGGLDLAGQDVQEGNDVGQLIPVRVLEAHVQQVCPAADLAAADLGALFVLPLADETAELATAQDVGPLADDDGPDVLIYDQGLDARDPGLMQLGRLAGRFSGNCLGQQADMFRDGAAAAAHQVHPARRHKPADGAGHHFRSLVVLAVLVGQSGVGDAGDGKAGQRCQGTDVVRHELRAGGAVKADPQEVTVGQGGV